jgi:hypothetical protein
VNADSHQYALDCFFGGCVNHLALDLSGIRRPIRQLMIKKIQPQSDHKISRTRTGRQVCLLDGRPL